MHPKGDSCMCIDIKIVSKTYLREAKFPKKKILGGTHQTPYISHGSTFPLQAKILYAWTLILLYRKT